MIKRFILTIFAVLLLFSAVSAQNPVKTSCNDDGLILRIGGSVSAIDHWLEGECSEFYENPEKTGHDFGLSTMLIIPMGDGFLQSSRVGLEYNYRNLNYFEGFQTDWKADMWTLSVSFDFKVGD